MPAILKRVLVLGVVLCIGWLVTGQEIHSEGEFPSLPATFRSIGCATGIHSVAFSLADSTFATGSYEGQVALWDVASGEKLAIFFASAPFAHRSSVQVVAFSRDGTRLAAFFGGGHAAIWDTATGEQVSGFEIHGSPYLLALPPQDVPTGGVEAARSASSISLISTATFSHDLTLLITAFPDGRIWLWNMSTGERVGDVAQHSSVVGRPAFSSDGRLLAFASTDVAIEIWDVLDGRRTSLISGPGQPLAFSPEGEVLAVSDGQTIVLWDLSAAHPVRTFVGYEENVTNAAFSPKEGLLVSASSDGTIVFWDLVAGRMALLYSRLVPTNVGELAFSTSGNMLAIGYVYTVPSSPAIALWSLQNVP